MQARYLRVTNYHIPELKDAKFAIAGFRAFGLGLGAKPASVSQFTARRGSDRRDVELSWKATPGAIGYNVRYGTRPDKMYHNYIVYDDDSLVIHSLDKTPGYYFAIDSFSENGVTKGVTVVSAP